MTDTASSTVDPRGLFADNHRWGDMAALNRDALALHDHGGVFRVEDDRHWPFWAVVDHATLHDIERHPGCTTALAHCSPAWSSARCSPC